MKSVLTKAKTIALESEFTREKLREGYVGLRLAAGSLCGTDLHYFKDFANAGFALEKPVTLGHEACAYVVDPNGSAFVAGQLVALNPIINCQECEACLRGEENLCTAKKFPGSATTRPHIDGFFRSEFTHPARCCIAVPENVNPLHLTFAEPLACALHSLNKANVKKGDKVLVTGCGPMGLLAAAGATARDATVSALDLRAEAVEVAKRLGKVQGLVAGEFDEKSIEGSYDIVIEASGAIAAFNTGLKALKRKGTLSILSNMQQADKAALLNLIMLKELNVVGSFQFNKEFGEAVELVVNNAINFDALTDSVFPLEKVQKALEQMASGKAYGKIVITPE